MKYIYFHVFILTYKNIESGWFTFCKNHNGNRYKLCLVVCHKSNTFDLKCGCKAAAFLLFIKILHVHIQIYLSTFYRNKKEKKPEWMDESPEKRDEE